MDAISTCTTQNRVSLLVRGVALGEGPAGEELVGAAGMALTGYKSNSGWCPREEKTGGKKGSGAVLPLLGRRWSAEIGHGWPAGRKNMIWRRKTVRGKPVHN
jgi:hypothetical protein